MEQLTSVSNSDASLAEAVSMISFKSSQGVEVQATLVSLTPQSVTFEMYSPEGLLRLSESLSDFRIYADSRTVYSGNAVVSHLVYSGAITICEAALTGAVLDLDLFQLTNPEKVLPAGFHAFLDRWQKFYKVSPEYKLAVADLQSFLEELRMWLDQIELGVRGLPTGDRQQMERDILKALPANAAISALFERFEAAAREVPRELVGAHRAFCRRQLHPLILCAPFMHRIFTKPLGYAGDYEMIDMIIRNAGEGGSLFAKLLHLFIIDQAPARSVRNRVDYFERRFLEETARVTNRGREIRIFSLGCGPAREVQTFMMKHQISDKAHFSLLDFNEETLRHTERTLTDIKRRHQRRTPVKLIRQTVLQLLKASCKPNVGAEGYDLIYCSGLYDYLNDRVCKALNNYLYEQLLPGGLLITTNFDPSNPIRQIQEHLFDWFLIYRDAPQFAALAPAQAPVDNCKVHAEYTGCNIFLQARKPG